jgi:hypothetical protein
MLPDFCKCSCHNRADLLVSLDAEIAEALDLVAIKDIWMQTRPNQHEVIGSECCLCRSRWWRDESPKHSPDCLLSRMSAATKEQHNADA